MWLMINFYNSVNVLAINLEEKLDGICEKIKIASQDVSELANYAEMYQRKVDLKHFKKHLSVSYDLPVAGKKYRRRYKVEDVSL